MKVILKKIRKLSYFNEIKVGESFILEGGIYIKALFSCDNTTHAIELEFGIIHDIPQKTLVEPINLEAREV